MEDIVPQLLEQLKKRFFESIAANPKIRALDKRIREGKATYVDAEEYAYLIGEALSQTLGKYLSSEVLPSGRMYYNIAERVLRPLLEEDHAIISQAAAMVQTFLNQKAKIGIKAQTVAVNADRIKGIIDKVSNVEVFDDVAWVLDEPVKNFFMNVVDETIKANVNFQGRSGLTPKIIRKAERKCCDWCAQLAGEYDYPDIPDEVYQRHERCRCTVEYDPADGKGKRQNVHTRQWTDPDESDIMIKRRVIGLRSGRMTVNGVSDHAIQRIRERNVTMESVIDALEHPLDSSEVKYDAAGRPSITITGRKATIAINPDTGNIVTVHATHTKTAEKLLKGK